MIRRPYFCTGCKSPAKMGLFFSLWPMSLLLKKSLFSSAKKIKPSKIKWNSLYQNRTGIGRVKGGSINHYTKRPRFLYFNGLVLGRQKILSLTPLRDPLRNPLRPRLVGSIARPCEGVYNPISY
jgi:hypothetical protein